MPNPTAPGVYVRTSSAGPAPSTVVRTATFFMTGESQVGPVGVAIPLQSLSDYTSMLGGRSGYMTAYDSCDELFRDGCPLVYFSRVVGPTATDAAVVLKDGSAANTLTVTANGAGVWGNDVTVTVAAGTAANSYVLTITDPATGRTWVSPNLLSPADAVTWAANTAGAAPWAFPFTIANDGSATAAPGNNPATGTFTLTGGNDDLADVVEAQWTAALTAFSSELGPGQVAAPGHNTQDGWEALIAHASAKDTVTGALIYNRVALCDDQDSATASTVVSQVAEAQAGSGDSSFAFFLGPWVIVPGVPGTTANGPQAANTRTVPPSALVGALMAATDAVKTPGQPAAGPVYGASGYAVGVTQSYDESDRGSLDQAGVSIIRVMNGKVMLYGYKTISTDPSWVSGSFARMRMALTDELNQAAQGFAFEQIDGQGHLLADFAGVLSGICQNYWAAGALYGATAAEAFQVNVGASVNSPETLAAGQLNAVVSVRFSPFAEFVQIAVVNYPITQALAA